MLCACPQRLIVDQGLIELLRLLANNPSVRAKEKVARQLRGVCPKREKEEDEMVEEASETFECSTTPRKSDHQSHNRTADNLHPVCDDRTDDRVVRKRF